MIVSYSVNGETFEVDVFTGKNATPRSVAMACEFDYQRRDPSFRVSKHDDDNDIYRGPSKKLSVVVTTELLAAMRENSPFLSRYSDEELSNWF